MHAWILLSCLSLVALQEISIFTKNINTAHEIDVGVLSYDNQQRASTYRALSAISFNNSRYSVCARDLALTPVCFGYQEGGFGGDFQIFVDSKGDIASLSFVRGKVPLLFNSLVISVSPASKPNLTPYNKQTQSQAKTLKVVRKTEGENEAGEKVQVEEEVEQVVEADSRSWVQKNWMYIVPPLVLFLIFSPSEKTDASA